MNLPESPDRSSALRRGRRADLWAWALLAALVAAWIVLMLRNLGYLSMWMDEGFHALAVDGVLKHGYPLYPSGHIYWKAILYVYVLTGLAKVFGATALTFRVFSVLCGAGLITLAYFVGRRFFSRTIGFLAALILAFSVWEVEYSRLALYFVPLQLAYLAGLYFFYQAFIEDRRRFIPWVYVLFILIPQVHQLGMGLIFCFPALLVVRGWKRFWKKDHIVAFGVVTLSYCLVQVHEYFFWKVGYVYYKDDASLGGMIRYFFSSFNFTFFKELFGLFPLMTLVVLGGIFLYLGRRAAAGGETGDPRDRPWLYLILCLLFPLIFWGIFRTRVQPRYLAQVYPVFVLLFLVGWQRASAGIADLVLAPFGAARPKAKAVAAGLVFLAGAGILTEGAGPGRMLSIINRRYNDRITSELITRSGRFEHYDNKTPGEYVRRYWREGDIVIATHMIFQQVYGGRVDYWLWSGGPGTWDAWEKTADGWREYYVGARWISDLAGLKGVIEGDPKRRVWIVGSPSMLRRDHVSTDISGYVRSRPENLVFRGKDGLSETYLWNDAAGELTGQPRTLEGEWLPARWGSVAYGENTSRQAWLAWKGNRRDEFDVVLPDSIEPVRYDLKLRAKTGPVPAGAEAVAVAVLDPRTGDTLRTLRVPAANGAWTDYHASFLAREKGGLRLRFWIPAGAELDLDWIDIVAAETVP
ncbi:MAG: glycosyltransferase family 39 protein [Acidobacteriota bacterium]|nr:glycosyltransferase family 39 protein [Acidobacteriota bacterium]